MSIPLTRLEAFSKLALTFPIGKDGVLQVAGTTIRVDGCEGEVLFVGVPMDDRIHTLSDAYTLRHTLPDELLQWELASISYRCAVTGQPKVCTPAQLQDVKARSSLNVLAEDLEPCIEYLREEIGRFDTKTYGSVNELLTDISGQLHFIRMNVLNKSETARDGMVVDGSAEFAINRLALRAVIGMISFNKGMKLE